MKLTTTLKLLEQYYPDSQPYDELVCFLSNGECDPTVNRRIKCNYDQEIPLELILAVCGLDFAVWSLCAVPGAERDSRLFAVFCARQMEHLMKAKKSRDAVDVSEQFANGTATQTQLRNVAALAVAPRDTLAYTKSPTLLATWAAWVTTWKSSGEFAADSAYGAFRAAGVALGSSPDKTFYLDQLKVFQQMCKGEAPWQVNSEYKDGWVLTGERVQAWYKQRNNSRKPEGEPETCGYAHIEMQKLLEDLIVALEDDPDLVLRYGCNLDAELLYAWKEKATNEESITNMTANQLHSLLELWQIVQPEQAT